MVAPRDDNPGAGDPITNRGPGIPKDGLGDPSIQIPGERGNFSQNPPGRAPGWKNFLVPGNFISNETPKLNKAMLILSAKPQK